MMKDPDLFPIIFAELQYSEHYADVHAGLVAHLCQHFSPLKSGLQGDSHISIINDGQEVMGRCCMDIYAPTPSITL
ncbi:hypothetical protein [Ochrobactrum sp. SFR4]|jgi:hypothetical protein|uniref:hypothetical protein n=1 Tax=Ochrobactrum sp. SFR4 TaxID=2717368 RepID=UPI001C8B7F32|nr:hypothetical protein [Ochrobactrum sp. SFR4]MBX8818939.1 hypothetical protein [Ochrobactrum sp. MR31]MBX8827716.1 hypothetical protein [Ochrobactrum sp. SFR4]